jgi:hypothetical protein
MEIPKIAKKGYVSLILIIAISFLLIHIVQAVTADPGTDTNPLVSQDYVDAKVNALTNTINNLKMQGAKYEVVNIKAGKQLVTGDSTEIILRQGKAKAIGSDAGGLSDLTGAIDIQTGGNIPSNHLLLVPRNDGRGLKATTDIIVLIKGIYTIS